jgi:hypothetical protein
MKHKTILPTENGDICNKKTGRIAPSGFLRIRDGL